MNGPDFSKIKWDSKTKFNPNAPSLINKTPKTPKIPYDPPPGYKPKPGDEFNPDAPDVTGNQKKEKPKNKINWDKLNETAGTIRENMKIDWQPVSADNIRPGAPSSVGQGDEGDHVITYNKVVQEAFRPGGKSQFPVKEEPIVNKKKKKQY